MELQAMAQELGYEVTDAVDTGEAAIESVESDPPDIILMDIRLPGEIDGVDAVKKIKAEREIPVIFITAHSDEETLGRAKETRPAGYLVKPITDRDLESTLEMIDTED